MFATIAASILLCVHFRLYGQGDKMRLIYLIWAAQLLHDASASFLIQPEQVIHS